MSEVHLGVIDDVIGANRSNEIDFRRTAHAGDLRAERLGNLHRECADPTRSANDQDLLARLDAARVTQPLECREPSMRYRGRLCKRQVRRLWRELVLSG